MNILVTGGSSGLGESLTKRIAQDKDINVYFTYVNAIEKAESLERKFTNVTAVKCDFRVSLEVEDLCKNIKDWDIDVLINNAYTGEFLKSYFHKTEPNDFLDAFRDNIYPTIKITQAAIAVFRKKKFGKIITVLTAALANIPPIGSAVYVANKAYLQQLSKVWATENSKFNISANTVSPAFMQTGFTNDMDERIVEQIIANHPLKRLLTIDEVADSVFFLVNSSQQINGIDLMLNAGTSLK
ncbi:MAG: SDR family oxidoreductase [Bacteroidota bacterium]